jgi:hypothetical protein
MMWRLGRLWLQMQTFGPLVGEPKATIATPQDAAAEAVQLYQLCNRIKVSLGRMTRLLISHEVVGDGTKGVPKWKLRWLADTSEVIRRDCVFATLEKEDSYHLREGGCDHNLQKFEDRLHILREAHRVLTGAACAADAADAN